MLERKALTGLKVTDEAAGTFEAVFATLSVIDKDGDVTLPGEFRTGQKARVSAYNHKSWDGALPVGKGTISERDDLAVMTGQFFMNIPGAKDTFLTVKELGDLAEWSYGFDAKRERGVFGPNDTPVTFLKEIEVHEVSPVILGAGIDTRTLSMKAGMKLSEHAGAVVTALDELTSRVADVHALRLTQGKTLGDDTMSHLEQLEVQMKRLRDVLTTEPPPKQDDQAALLRELARVQARRATILTT